MVFETQKVSDPSPTSSNPHQTPAPETEFLGNRTFTVKLKIMLFARNFKVLVTILIYFSSLAVKIGHFNGIKSVKLKVRFLTLPREDLS